jgi:hypothetical protein
VPGLRETDLYQPLKTYLEGQGYDVKSEIADCDVVAVRGGEDPVIVELKTAFSLPLVFQGIRRQTITDQVYLAFPTQERASDGTIWRRQKRDVVKLCRQLGLGLVVVRFGAKGRTSIEVPLDPAPYRPRKNARQKAVLLREFERRVGDPNQGGSNKRPIVTAYRQDALRCAAFLDRAGPTKASVLKTETGVENAARILQQDHYGWFQRVERGIYELTPNGKRGLDTFADVVASLTRPCS